MVLLLIISIIILLPRIITDFSSKEPLLVTFKELDSGISEMQRKQHTSVAFYKKKVKKYKRPPSKFDPNHYQENDWMALGLSPKQAQVILKFTKWGIKNNEELQQIFVIDDQLFQLIKDSTFYPVVDNSPHRYKSTTNKRGYTPISIELNKATIEQLVKLPMIGESMARFIVERREKLGGYHSVEQLLEIKYLDKDKLDVIKPQITVDISQIKLININTCSTEELQKHPYIGWNVANSIIKMRVYLKKYTNFDQLLESKLISIELLEKITPYLTLED